MIDPQDLADEMYKLDTPYYDDIPEKTKHDIAYKNAMAKAAEKEQQNQMNNLSDILKNTQPLPQQFAGMQGVERDPVKRQQILDTQEQAMIAKQNAGGTFTDADLEPYKRAGYQSQNTQSASPMADQFVQAVGAGVDPNVAKTAIGMNQKEGDSYVDWGYGQKKNERTGEIIHIPVKPDRERSQILQTDQGYVEYNKDTGETKPLNIRKPMTSEQQDAVEKIKTLKDTLNNIDTLHDEGYTGAVQGRLGWARTKTGIGTNEREQMFRAKTSELMKMVYALSGKQINEQEMERLRPFLPEVNDSDIAFKTKVKALKEQLDTVYSNKIKLYTGGVGAIGQEEKPNKKVRMTADDFLKKYGGK